MSTSETTLPAMAELKAARLEAMWEVLFHKWDGEEGVTYQGLNGSRKTIMAKLRRMLSAADEVERKMSL